MRKWEAERKEGKKEGKREKEKEYMTEKKRRRKREMTPSVSQGILMCYKCYDHRKLHKMFGAKFSKAHIS